MANKRGPRQTGRKLLATVAASILLYAAPIWVEATLIKSYAKQSACVRRFCALRVCSAYRTVSDDASIVIAGLYPDELLAIEPRRHSTKPHRARTLCRRNTIQLWQLRWSTSKKGRWTYNLIPNIEQWLNRKHGEVDFYLTQILTGHGCFRSYLYRFKRADSPYCTFCKNNIIEDAEHVFFVCPRFETYRSELSSSTGWGLPTVISLVELLLDSKENWFAISTMASSIIHSLRQADHLLTFHEEALGHFLFTKAWLTIVS